MVVVVGGGCAPFMFWGFSSQCKAKPLPLPCLLSQDVQSRTGPVAGAVYKLALLPAFACKKALALSSSLSSFPFLLRTSSYLLLSRLRLSLLYSPCLFFTQL